MLLTEEEKVEAAAEVCCSFSFVFAARSRLARCLIGDLEHERTKKGQST